MCGAVDDSVRVALCSFCCGQRLLSIVRTCSAVLSSIGDMKILKVGHVADAALHPPPEDAPFQRWILQPFCLLPMNVWVCNLKVGLVYVLCASPHTFLCCVVPLGEFDPMPSPAPVSKLYPTRVPQLPVRHRSLWDGRIGHGRGLKVITNHVGTRSRRSGWRGGDCRRELPRNTCVCARG